MQGFRLNIQNEAFNILRDKAISIINACSFLFYMICVFFLPVSNAIVESSMVTILILFAIRSIIKSPTIAEIKAFFKDGINLCLLVFYLAIGLSIFTSGPLFDKSLHAWIGKWGQGMLFFYVSQFFLDKKKIKILLYVFAASTLLVCVDGIYQRLVGYDFIRGFNLATVTGLGNNLSGVTATFRHYNDFAAFLVVVFFILLGLSRKSTKILLQSFIIFVIILTAVNLVFTYSRGAWASFLIINVLLMIYSPDKKIKAYSLTSFILFMLGIIIIPSVGERFIFMFKKGGDATRFRVWGAAIEMFKDSPILGKGLGTFMGNFRQYSKLNIQYAHNCYLQILAESGLLGLVSFLWFLGQIVIGGYKKLCAKSDSLFLGLFSAFLAFLVHIFFDTQLYTVKLSALFWVLATFITIYIRNIKLNGQSEKDS